MAVKDLQARMGNVNIELTISEKSEPREFEKFGKTGRVCNCVGRDDTGKISLTLWNDDVDKVNIGDKVKITNGWVGEYQGELQLSTGKFGKLEVEKGDGLSEPATPQTEKAPEAAPEQPTESTPQAEPVVEEEVVE
jgi:replication factor A1